MGFIRFEWKGFGVCDSETELGIKLLHFFCAVPIIYVYFNFSFCLELQHTSIIADLEKFDIERPILVNCCTSEWKYKTYTCNIQTVKSHKIELLFVIR